MCFLKPWFKGRCACDEEIKVLLGSWCINAGSVSGVACVVMMDSKKGNDKKENEGKRGENLGKKKI